ncbi:MAG: YicC/YloC family endoribonuclease [Lachnospiraceae bacterium]
MIRSMTGFASCEQLGDGVEIRVEIRSVNHRYFESQIKMPRKISMFEHLIRNILKKHIARGKVDVAVFLENLNEKAFQLDYREELAAKYLTYIHTIRERFAIAGEVTAAELARFPEIFSLTEAGTDTEGLWEPLEQALMEALRKFNDCREAEGAELQTDLLDKLQAMSDNVQRIEEREPLIIENYQKKLTEKVTELLGDTQLDSSRIAMEVVMFSDKICSDEETVRLKSHIKTMQSSFQTRESIGRKLDFIAQEMNREANTILSKSNDLETSNLAIDLKTGIEKIREQIQNIE